MKKIITLLSSILLGGFFISSLAQCNFTNAGVKLNGTPYTNPQTGQCMIHFDLYFDLAANSGGKYVYVHIWPNNSYPSLKYLKPPHYAELVNSVATFGFYHHSNELYILNSYTPDNSIPNFQFDGLTIQKGKGTLAGYDRFVISGLVIASSQDCSIPQPFTADAWQSQSAEAQNVHCFSKGLAFYANDPKATGLLFCQVPRQYLFSVSTINSSGMNIDFKVVIDNGDGIYNAASDILEIFSGNNISLNASNDFKYSSGIKGYLPYSNQKPEADRSLWVVITSADVPNDVYYRIDNLCIGLPVSLANFTVFRKNNMVTLQWETLQEQDNSGFYIERETAGSWVTTGFVKSKAVSGNSTEQLFYQYAEENLSRDISRYRLRQADLNGQTRYSAIRMVRGMEQERRLLLFPNPSGSGNINMLVNDAGGPFSVSIYDMNGRMVKSYVNCTENSMTVGSLSPGIYLLKVQMYQTREVLSGKFIIQ